MSDDLDFAGTAQALAALDSLDVPALELLYKLERNGGQFYELLAERVGNDDAAELLRRNGREEVGHARRVSRAIAIKLDHDWTPTDELEADFPIQLPTTIDASMLRGLVRGEQVGDADYQRWADAEPNPDVERLLRLNGREESIHGGRVEQVVAMLESSD